MRFHSRELLYFDEVRRAGSIREAARRLNVASSAVNRKILQIEQEIGMPLFERHATGVSLTAAGEALARHAISVLQDLDRTTSELEALRGGQRGRVTVAAVESVCLSPLPEVIRDLQGATPRVEVEVLTAGSRTIPDLLVKGHVDVGIAFDVAPVPEIARVFSVSLPLGAVMSPEHALATKTAVSLADCSAYPLVRARANLSSAPRIAELMAAVNLSLPSAVVTDSIALMQGLAMTPPYVSFQTPLGLEDLIAAGKLVFVPLAAREAPFARLGVYMRDGRSLPAAVDGFLRMLRQHLDAVPGLGK